MLGGHAAGVGLDGVKRKTFPGCLGEGADHGVLLDKSTGGVSGHHGWLLVVFGFRKRKGIRLEMIFVCVSLSDQFFVSDL